LVVLGYIYTWGSELPIARDELRNQGLCASKLIKLPCSSTRAQIKGGEGKRAGGGRRLEEQAEGRRSVALAIARARRCDR
jgi:hypothetical protein